MLNTNILIWPGNHTFQACERLGAFENSQQDIYDLYQHIHTRSEMDYTAKDVIASLSLNDVDGNQNNQVLCTAEPDLPLTIVTISRNDEHVERMRERSQAFIDGVFFLAEKYKTKVELILVEWNPPADTPSMAEQFTYPQNHEYVSVIIVTVPREVHQSYNMSQNLPLYQMIGKNVGIRRARGNFVLSTNIDVLLSEELFQEITKVGLQKGRIYRSNRWDVDQDILDQTSAGNMIAVARDLTFQKQYRTGTSKGADTGAHMEPEQTVKASDFDRKDLLPQLHTMACGDFQMMAREDWYKVRGYPELDSFSFHLDSLFSLMCHYQGLDEMTFSDGFPHYHIDHSLGTEVKTDAYIMQNKATLKHISYNSLIFLHVYMADTGGIQMNRAHWGLAHHSLPVAHVTRALWETDKAAHYALHQTDLPACVCDLKKLETCSQRVVEGWIETNITRMARFIQGTLKGRPFYIWGAGGRGNIYYHRFRHHGIDVKGFIQSKNVETMKAPAPIFGPDIFDDVSEPNSFVGIASIFAEEIRPLLEAKDMQEGRDYIVLM